MALEDPQFRVDIIWKNRLLAITDKTLSNMSKKNYIKNLCNANPMLPLTRAIFVLLSYFKLGIHAGPGVVNQGDCGLPPTPLARAALPSVVQFSRHEHLTRDWQNQGLGSLHRSYAGCRFATIVQGMCSCMLPSVARTESPYR